MSISHDDTFLPQDHDYRSLKAFQKAECIYDVTFFFAHNFLQKGDRTIDQMVQAARSGKQNLAEGNIDGIASREMEIKLTTVNRASLHELLLDYEDYLRVRGLQHWGPTDPRYQQTAAFCRAHLDSAIYREKIQERSDETIANIAITLIHQCDALIIGLIEWYKRDFKENGGIKEEMYRARKDWQRRNGFSGGELGGRGGSRGQGGRSGSCGQGGHSGSCGQGGQGGQGGQIPAPWRDPSLPTPPTMPTKPTKPTPPTTPTPPTKPTPPTNTTNTTNTHKPH